MAISRESLKYIKGQQGQLLISDQSITEPADNDRIFESPNDGRKYRDVSSQTFKTSIDKIRSAQTLNPNIIYKTMDFGVPGEWQVDESDTTSLDDTGSVLVTAGGQRLKKMRNGDVDIREYGGVTGIDISDALQSAINSLNNCTLYFPRGVYTLSKTILVPADKQIVFNGAGKLGVQGAGTPVDGISVFQWVGEDPSYTKAIECLGRCTASFKNLALWNNTARTDVDGLYLQEFRSNELSNVTISFFRRNLWLQDDHYYSTFNLCRFRAAKEDNVYVDGLANGVTYNACNFGVSAGRGFYGTNMGTHVNFIGCWTEASQGYGMEFENTQQVNIVGCYFENNGIGMVGSTRAQIRIRPWGFLTPQPVHLFVEGSSFSGQQQNQIYARGGDSSDPSLQNINITVKNNRFASNTFTTTDPTYLVNIVNSNKVSVFFEGNTEYRGSDPNMGFSPVPNINPLRNYYASNCEISSPEYATTGEKYGVKTRSIQTRALQLEGINGGSQSDGASVLFDSGSPEGVVVADQGSIYIRKDAADISERIYVKNTGSGNTGWVTFQPNNGVLGGVYQDANYIDTSSSLRLTTFGNSTGSTGYPSNAGVGILVKRSNQSTNPASFKIWKSNSNGDTNLYIQLMEANGVWGDFTPLLVGGSSELVGTDIDFRIPGSRYKSITSDLILTTSSHVEGKPVDIQITNTDVAVHTVTISGVSFPDGASNSIPAGGRAHIRLQQINGTIDSDIKIYT